ncbi:MAG: hypothetical protein IKH14_06950 [Prevotella sp.]|nr:hypothetical protein [Prevotella sp.]
MKAIPVLPKREREIIKKRADALVRERIQTVTEEERSRIIRESMKLCCLALHEAFGFGNIRLNRLINTINRLCEEKEAEDEVFWWKNDKVLEQAGLKLPKENYEEMM